MTFAKKKNLGGSQQHSCTKERPNQGDRQLGECSRNSNEVEATSLESSNSNQKRLTKDTETKNHGECELGTQDPSERQLTIKEVPQEQASESQIQILPSPGKSIKSNKKPGKRSTSLTDGRKVLQSKVEEVFNRMKERRNIASQPHRQVKQQVTKPEQQSQLQKEQSCNITFQATLVTKKLGRLAQRLGSSSATPSQTIPISKRTRKQIKIERKKQQKRRSDQKSKSEIIQDDKESSSETPVCSPKRRNKAFKNNKVQNCEDYQSQISQVENRIPKDKKKANLHPKQKPRQNRRKKHEEDSDSNLEQHSEIDSNEYKASRMKWRGRKLQPTEIRQIEKVSGHQTEYVVTFSDGSLKIMPIIEVVKNWPQEFVAYLQEKLESGLH